VSAIRSPSCAVPESTLTTQPAKRLASSKESNFGCRWHPEDVVQAAEQGGRRGLVGFTDESAAAAGSELVADTVVERERSEQPRDVGEPLLWRHVPDHFAWKGELVVAVVFESGARSFSHLRKSSKGRFECKPQADL
jgi:hypothetical protein